MSTADIGAGDEKFNTEAFEREGSMAESGSIGGAGGIRLRRQCPEFVTAMYDMIIKNQQEACSLHLPIVGSLFRIDIDNTPGMENSSAVKRLIAPGRSQKMKRKIGKCILEKNAAARGELKVFLVKKTISWTEGLLEGRSGKRYGQPWKQH